MHANHMYLSKLSICSVYVQAKFSRTVYDFCYNNSWLVAQSHDPKFVLQIFMYHVLDNLCSSIMYIVFRPRPNFLCTCLLNVTANAFSLTICLLYVTACVFT